LQKVLTRQQRQFDGKVEVLGKPLSDWGQDYFEKIGVGFELPNHYVKFTAVENLRFFASLYRSRSRDPLELLALVGLKDAAHNKVETFSKGMRMRLNFVRAIQHDPEILFLDEPTAGIDPINARVIKRIIADLRNAGKTIVLTTHNMNDVDQLCDRVSFMVSGRFVLSTRRSVEGTYGRRIVQVTHARHCRDGGISARHAGRQCAVPDDPQNRRRADATQSGSKLDRCSATSPERRLTSRRRQHEHRRALAPGGQGYPCAGTRAHSILHRVTTGCS